MTLTIWIVAVVFVIGVVALTLVILSADGCSDSPHGGHEYMNQRTELGWRLRCVYCLRETPGIDVFPRTER